MYDAVQYSSLLTSEASENILLLQDSFITSSETANERHLEFLAKIKDISEETTSNFHLLAEKINESQKLTKDEQEKIKDGFESISEDLKKGKHSIDTLTEGTLQKIQELQQDVQNVYSDHFSKQKQLTEEVQELSSLITNFQHQVLQSQREHIEQTKKLGETSDIIGQTFSTFFQILEMFSFGFHIFQKFVKIFSIYFVLQRICEILFGPIQFQLKRYLRFFFLFGFFVEVLLPEFSRLSRIGILVALSAGFLFQILQFFNSSFIVVLFSNSFKTNQEDIHHLLIDYIVQLRISSGQAPIPEKLAELLATPPRGYIKGIDNEGCETIFSNS